MAAARKKKKGRARLTDPLRKRKILQHYGRDARAVVQEMIAVRHMGVREIADLLTQETGQKVGKSTLYRWLAEWQGGS